MKLNQGDRIQVHGFCMLSKLKCGKTYTVQKIDHERKIYWLSKDKSKSIMVGHYSNTVDPWLQHEDHPNLNKLVKLESVNA